MLRRALILLVLGLPAPVAGAPAWAQGPSAKDVVRGYADLAQGMYGDTLAEGRKLKVAVDALLADPTAARLDAARTAWKAARVPYMQTEGFRFGNGAVDDWEGRVNAWPLDEGLIDYVDAKHYAASPDENPFANANVIANPSIKAGGKIIDAARIDRKLLGTQLHEAGRNEANVAIGYHAIEFLLWGQDLNGTGPGAGNRPASDYAQGAGCTNGNCDRRADYLRAATNLLVDDLKEMADGWGAKGKVRAAVLKRGEKAGLGAILTGLGSLSYGELAGERMRLGLLLHDPEEEHDCFSDNTHNSHYYDALGMRVVYTGAYRRADGTMLTVPSLAAYAAAKAPRENDRLLADLNASVAAIGKLKEVADSGRMAYDQMLADGNAEGGALIQAGIDALVRQTRSIEAVVAALGLKIKVEGSDSLDDPGKVKN